MDLNDKQSILPFVRTRRDDVDPPNIVYLLNARQIGVKYKTSRHLKHFGELKASMSEMNETHCELPPSARSTFLMSFSHDCSKVASTHGDHNVYVSDARTGKHLNKLEGHPRTPWCISFHPTSNDILATGCLAGQVRVWDLHGGSEKWRAYNDQVIASLTFHPFLQMLVIATGSCLYFWDWSQPKPSAFCSTNSEIERVRYVKFDQYGHRLITGISNMGTCSSGSSMNSNAETHQDNPNIFTRQVRRSERLRRRNDDTSLHGPISSLNRSPSHSPQRSHMLSNRSRSSFVADHSFVVRQTRADRYRRSLERMAGHDFDLSLRSPTSPPVLYPTYTTEQERYIEALSQNIERLAEPNYSEESSPTTSSFSSSNESTPVGVDTLDQELYVPQLSRESSAREWGRMIAEHPSYSETSPPWPDPPPLYTGGNSLHDHALTPNNEIEVRRRGELGNSPPSTLASSSPLLADEDALYDHVLRRSNEINSEGMRRNVVRQNNEINIERRRSIELHPRKYLITSVLPVPRPFNTQSNRQPIASSWSDSSDEEDVRIIVPQYQNTSQAARNSSLKLEPLGSAVNFRNESFIPPNMPSSVSSITSSNSADRMSASLPSTSGEFGVENTIESLFGDEHSNSSEETLVESEPDESEPFNTIRSICSDFSKQLRRNVYNLRSGYEESVDSSANENVSETTNSERHGNENLPEQESGEQFTTITNILTDIQEIVDSPCSLPANSSRSPAIHPACSRSVALLDKMRKVCAKIKEMVRRLRYWTKRSISHYHKKIFEDVSVQLTQQLEILTATTLDFSLAGPSRLAEETNAKFQALNRFLGAASTSGQSLRRSPRLSQNQVPVTLNDNVRTLPGRSVSISVQAMSQNASRRSLSISVQNNSQNASGAPARIQEHFPSHRYNPLVIARNFRRNFNPSCSSNRPRQSNISSRRPRGYHRSGLAPFTGMSDESFLRDTIRTLPRLSLAARQRFAVFYGDEDPEEFQEEEQEQEQESPENRRSLSSLIASAEPISDNSSDESERPATPQQLMYLPSYTSWLFNGNSRMALGDPLTQNHRIQIWNFTPYKLPEIYDATANIVVRECLIHNDASVDISQDGEKLVTLIPSEKKDSSNDLLFGVYSLRKEDLGRNLCVWGFISNAISVSFSPLANYVVVGSAYSRPIFSNPEKTTVAQIVKIHDVHGSYKASFVRSFTQLITNESRFQQVSLNCVMWIPQPGLGIAYATNRGCLSICKPMAGEIFGSTNEENVDRRNLAGAQIQNSRYLFGSNR